MYYFASDIHLGSGTSEQSRSRELRFVRWLEEMSEDAEAIFLVGDVFDFWYEYRRVVPKGFTRLLGALSALTDRGTEIHFFTGNHDMWIGDYLHGECGLVLHTKAEIMNLYGRRCYIAHGDNELIEPPLSLRLMNCVFRSEGARWLFSRLVHPDAALRFGRWWSGRSRKLKALSHEFGGESEPLVRYARRMSERDPSIDCFIFGHNHCAEIYPLGGGAEAVFLGEWIEHPTYAALGPDGKVRLLEY